MHTRSICTRDLLASLLLTLVLLLVIAISNVSSAYAEEDARPASNTTASLTQMLSNAWNTWSTTSKLEAFVDDERAGDFYFAQNGSGRCTITSVAMMVRRAAFLDDADWESIGLSTVTSDGWTSAGVKWSFATAGYDIGIIDVDGTAESLVKLLDEHPEGIAAYDPGVPHAILLTDYDEQTGTFYCADPAGYYSGKRIPIADSWNGACRGNNQDAVISGLSRAWVVL